MKNFYWKIYVSFLFIQHIPFKYFQIILNVDSLFVLMRSYLRILKRSDEVSIKLWNEKTSLKRFSDAVLKFSSIMWLTVREKLNLIPKLFINPMWKVIVFKKIDFLAMFILRKLVVKNLKILFNCCIFHF